MSYATYRARKRVKKLLFYLIVCFGFLLTWSLLTFLILYFQNTILGPTTITPSALDDNGNYPNNGIQVVVGHFNGNLPKEKANYTEEQLNANEYAPYLDWGEWGKPVQLSITEEVAATRTFGINQFNLYVSDRISVRRKLPDARKRQCVEKKYDLRVLPTTSVIIVFHNEAYSTLMRTIYSIVDRSPLELLQEIILVDDFSTRTFLQKPLEDELIKLPVRTKIVRAKERIGLIRARMIGAQEATGDTLTFLDSHVECTIGWLEPLLARIHENRKSVVCPVIDVINDRTFAYQRGMELFRGGFNWNLQFRWYTMPAPLIKKRTENPTSPIDTPTMAGGLFSIDRNYFEELGAYDPSMDIWGGENLEISFRIWQCGGRIEILPCSRVGHIFRKASPHDFPGKSSSTILNVNLLRVAEVWMDEWKYLFYKTAHQAYNLREEQDVSDRIELRRRLHCKSFEWYLDNVFTDHFLPSKQSTFGRIRNNRNCLTRRPGDVGKAHSITVAECTLGFDTWQMWVLNTDGRIRSDEHQCLSASQSNLNSYEWVLQLKECTEWDNEYWTYTPKHHTFVHKESGLCLDLPVLKKNEELSRDTNNPPTLKACGYSNTQKWRISSVQWLPDNYYEN